jgi:hypothetical protein
MAIVRRLDAVFGSPVAKLTGGQAHHRLTESNRAVEQVDGTTPQGEDLPPAL